MDDFEKIYDFTNLYHAHLKTRRCKRSKAEVIRFEVDLAANLCTLSDMLKEDRYLPVSYYNFKVFEPKRRDIHALRYPDRVVQRCLCDEVLAPTLDSRLIHDNAACRKGKGTHFSLGRLSGFMREHHRQRGTDGYLLKCDIRKYFQNINHTVLKGKLARLPLSQAMLQFLFGVIDSYESSPDCGLPLGNQSSQWFALYYLDSVYRLIKERLRVKHYVRYMDDFILLHDDKAFLLDAMRQINVLLNEQLGLELNQKTQISPLCGGVNYLGFHLRLTKTGKVVRSLQPAAKRRFIRAMRSIRYELVHNALSPEGFRNRVSSHQGHLSHGHTRGLQQKWMLYSS